MVGKLYRRFFKIREDVSMPARMALGLIPALVIVAVWILLTRGKAESRIISPLILPSPGEVLHSFHSLWFDAELSRSMIASALRVIGGFVIALMVAFPLGVFMGTFSNIKAIFSPLATFGAYLPIPTLVPLTMSLFGIGEFQKIMFLALAFFVYLLPLFVKAIDSVDNVYLQTAYTLGAGRWQILRRVLLGISLPQIFHAMRLGFGIGWTYIILAEMVAADRGLGTIIIVAQRRGPREHIYLVLVAIVIIAFITDRIWVWLGRMFFPYLEQK
ncbi:MAG: ABC transporter permease [Candidatus Aminicenantes bacterium]|nr:ABC transporter permease [Candidatus Aminicenantes bacterium]